MILRINSAGRFARMVSPQQSLLNSALTVAFCRSVFWLLQGVFTACSSSRMHGCSEEKDDCAKKKNAGIGQRLDAKPVHSSDTSVAVGWESSDDEFWATNDASTKVSSKVATFGSVFACSDILRPCVSFNLVEHPNGVLEDSRKMRLCFVACRWRCWRGACVFQVENAQALCQATLCALLPA